MPISMRKKSNEWSIFENFLEDQTPPPKKILTHYTSLDGFLKIIDSNQLWASNVRYLNDKQEIEYGIDKSCEFLNSIRESVPISYHKKLISSAPENIKKNPIDVYACCFSEEEDSLSQWRGYGGKTQGVAIEFNYSLLEAYFLKYDAKLRKVIYGDDETEKTLKRKFVDQIIERKDGKKAFILPGMIENTLNNLIPSFKHGSFAQEAEWRLLVTEIAGDKELEFRTKDNVLIPFIKLGDKHKKNLLPIKTVRVGPGKDVDLTITSIENYLKHRGFEKVPVKPSATPFRS